MFGMIGRLLRWLGKESLFGVVGASVVEGGKSIFEDAKRAFAEDMTKQAPPEGRGHLTERILNLRDDTARENLIARYKKRVDCISPFTYGDAEKMEVAIVALLQEIKNPSREEEILKTLGLIGEDDFNAIIPMLYADPKFVAFFRKSWSLLKEGGEVFWKQANALAGPIATGLESVNDEMRNCIRDFELTMERPGKNLFVFPWQR